MKKKFFTQTSIPLGCLYNIKIAEVFENENYEDILQITMSAEHGNKFYLYGHLRTSL